MRASDALLSSATCLLTLFCLIDLACSGPNNLPSPEAVPHAAPSAAPGALSWIQVTERKSCPYPNCPAQQGFSVTSSGQYSIDSQPPAGQVTPSELVELSSVASTIASRDGLAGFSCVPATAVPGMSGVTVTLTLASGTTETVYAFNTGQMQSCFSGSQATAQALYQEIDALAGKYDAAPGSAPSGSSSLVR